jgi:DNA invertase Pin-like site-specific DNA recombinase
MARRASMTPNRIPTALLYLRVSREDQARDGISIDVQLTECRRYAARQGWVLGTEYQDIMAGTRDDRPRYQALLTECRRLRAAGQPVVVVVAALDRFGRRLLERVRCREELKALDVPVHSVREGGEVSDLVANVLAAVAQEETRRLGERVSAAKQHLIETGWHPGGHVRWGYRLRDATSAERAAGAPQRVVEVDPLTAPYVQEAFERVARGESIRSVARWAQHLSPAARGRRALGHSAFSELLSAPVYIGRPYHGDPDVLRRPVGRWPALLSEDLWVRVQERIAGHARRPHQSSGRHLLTGFVRCPKCGSRMSAHPGSQGRSYRFVCDVVRAGANAPRADCRCAVLMPAIEAGTLAEVASNIELVAASDPGLQRAIRQAWRSLQEPSALAAGTARRRQLERVVAQAKKRLTDAALLLVDGVLDRDGYDLARAQAQADLDAASAELAQFQAPPPPPTLPPLDAILREVGGWAAALESAEVPVQRQMLDALVEHIVPVRVGRGRYQVEITWTSLGVAIRQLAAFLADEAEALNRAS